jgi:general secretion pathway protein A
MYLEFYGLNEKPFEISTNSKFLWLGEKHREALSMLKYGILDNKGFLLLTGDVGTGKTTLINALIGSLGSDTIAATIPDPGLEPIEFYNFVASAFNMDEVFHTKGSFLVHFNKFLQEAHAGKQKVLLIIDEAQRLSPAMLEEIRLLSNIEKEDTKLVNIFFIGQNEFNRSLLRNENRALRQRITLNYHIEPLSEEEVDAYLAYRLKVAGCERRIFTQEAVADIHFYTEGFPRLINILSDLALLTGYVRESNEIGGEVIHSCVDQLRIEAPAMPELEEIEATSVQQPVQEIPAQQIQEVRSPENILKDRNPPERIIVTESKDFQFRNVVFLSLTLGVLLFVLVLQFPDLYHKYTSLFKGTAASEQVSQDQEKASAPVSTHPSQIEENQTAKKDAAVNNPAASSDTSNSVSDSGRTAQATPPEAISDKAENLNLSQSLEDLQSQASVPDDRSKAEKVDSVSVTEVMENLDPLPEEPIRVYFNYNSNELNQNDYASLDLLANHMELKPEMRVEVIGYTDSSGKPSYNKWLSEFRANIVKIYLVGKGISAARINALGKGQENPIASNETPEGRRKNRRVEVNILSSPAPLS